MRRQRLYALVYGGFAVASAGFGVVWWIGADDAVLGGVFLLLAVLCIAAHRLITQPARQRARRAAERAAPAGAGEHHDAPPGPVAAGGAPPLSSDPGSVEQHGGVIVVERPRGYHYAVFRRYRICIDGRTVGRLRRGEIRFFPVSPGPHTVSARIDWSGSPELVVDVPAGGRVALEVEPSEDPFLGAFSSDKSLTLTPVPTARPAACD